MYFTRRSILTESDEIGLAESGNHALEGFAWLVRRPRVRLVVTIRPERGPWPPKQLASVGRLQKEAATQVGQLAKAEAGALVERTRRGPLLQIDVPRHRDHMDPDAKVRGFECDVGHTPVVSGRLAIAEEDDRAATWLGSQ